MNLIKRHFFICITILIFFLSLVTDWYDGLSILFACAIVVTILDKLGKGIVLRELIILHAVFVCLLMPVVGYDVYNKSNHLARIFLKFMPIPRERYFSYVLPAVSAFATALCWPIRKNHLIVDEGVSFQHLIGELREKLKDSTTAGIILIVIGMILSTTQSLVPVEFKFFVSLFYSASFVGILYVYYSPSFRYKRLVFTVFVAFLVWNAVQTGVFTIVAYMGITLFSFFFVGKKYAFWKKLLICIISIFSLFLIQNIKAAFRKVAWEKNFAGSKTDLFGNIAYEKVTHLDDFIDLAVLFPTYTRTNQGFNISLVMRRMPAAKDFDGGERLSLMAASSLVPRILWPDKPEAGGAESMLYFTGYKIVGYSTNVGPVGEAYGSFGVAGGIVFMFVLGIFIRAVYRKLFSIGRTMPLIILWIPVLFYQVTYSMETDTLQILNSLTKSAFFIWVAYKAFPSLFGIVKKDPKAQRFANGNQNITA